MPKYTNPDAEKKSAEIFSDSFSESKSLIRAHNYQNISLTLLNGNRNSSFMHLTVEEWKGVCELINDQASLLYVDFSKCFNDPGDKMYELDEFGVRQRDRYKQYTVEELEEIITDLSKAIVNHSNIKKVNLSNNALKDAHAAILAEKLLSCNKKINSINLQNTEITIAGMKQIIDAIASNPDSAIKKIYFPDINKISSEEKEQFIASIECMLKKHKSVEKISINCEELSTKIDNLLEARNSVEQDEMVNEDGLSADEAVQGNAQENQENVNIEQNATIEEDKKQKPLLPSSKPLFIATGALTLASAASLIAYKALSARINNVLFNRFLIAGSALTAVFAVGAGICAGVAKHNEGKLKSDDLRQASEGQERI